MLSLSRVKSEMVPGSESKNEKPARGGLQPFVIHRGEGDDPCISSSRADHVFARPIVGRESERAAAL